jgi:hypothetical protein
LSATFGEVTTSPSASGRTDEVAEEADKLAFTSDGEVREPEGSDGIARTSQNVELGGRR